MQDHRHSCDPTKSSAIDALLHSHGFAAHDFEVTEERSREITEILGLPTGAVSVRRHSTGHERLYAAGIGSTWYAALSADLDSGVFGHARGPAG